VRVAALADVHGNAPALEAVLADVEAERPDLIVFCGDVTWGPLPAETYELVRGLNALLVRGNAERALFEPQESERARWIVDRHGAELLKFARGFADHHVVDVDGLGATRFVHGSPRSDEECVTVETPPERVREFLDGVPQSALVTAHTHVGYARELDGVCLLNPGSVGLPYEGRPGAYWALLGPGIEHRRTEYDLEAALERMGAAGLPGWDEYAQLLVAPPTPAEVIADAEERVFAG
jgi:predicted phosphodiesterase